MASYVQNQVNHLNKNISDDSILGGNVHWISTPGSNRNMENDEWKEAISESGDIYYWNPRTRETKWK
jgi:hypothetical protein